MQGIPFPESFKRAMILRLLPPNPISAKALARQVDVSQSTLSKWLREAHKTGSIPQDSPMQPSKSFTPRQKFDLLQASQGLEGSELGAFLRTHGLHESDLQSWRADMLAALDKPSKATAPSRRADKKRIRELERELRRKEKALAEAAALLVLQKKVRALWEVEEDSTDQSRGEQS